MVKNETLKQKPHIVVQRNAISPRLQRTHTDNTGYIRKKARVDLYLDHYISIHFIGESFIKLALMWKAMKASIVK